MPYYISENHPDCSNWAVVKTDYELVACHDTKESAISQMVALSGEEDLEPGGTHPRDESVREAMGKDQYRDKEEAEMRAQQIGCTGTHSMDDNGQTIYMPCSTHEDYEKAMGSDSNYEAKEDGADTPAPKSDQRKGSDKNKPGSASTSRGNIKVSAKTKTALQNKVKEHNEKMEKADKPSHTRATYGQLAAVYRRGAGAYSTSHRPGVSRGAWAMARVNAYLYLLRNGSPKNSKYTQDNDLLPKGHPKSSKSESLREVKNTDLYSELRGDEKALVDAMYGVVQEYGRFGGEGSTVYVEYISPEDNDNRENGIKCGNCVFHYEAEDGLACRAVAAEIVDGGRCRFAQIPPGYFQETIKVREAEKMYKVPEGVQNAAKRAQKWIGDGKAGDGFTDTGRRRASQLASGGSVSLDTVKRMKSYFARHEVDRKATGFNSGEEGYPSAGRVAWDAWGGDAGRTWVNRLNLEDD